jgi:hypothetical protein
VLTFAVFQAEMFWLKAVAEPAAAPNIPYMLPTFAVFHTPMLWLKATA